MCTEGACTVDPFLHKHAVMQKLQAQPSNAMSLVGQQSVGSMTTPTPSGMAPPSIFCRTLPQGAAHAEGLTPEEEEQAQKLGFGGSELDPPSIRLLKAYALQQNIHAVQVKNPSVPLQLVVQVHVNVMQLEFA